MIGNDRRPVSRTEMRFLRGGVDSKRLLTRVEDDEGKRREKKYRYFTSSLTYRLESSSFYTGCTRGFPSVDNFLGPTSDL